VCARDIPSSFVIMDVKTTSIMCYSDSYPKALPMYHDENDIRIVMLRIYW
jgi:hypothetical protein